MKILFIAANPLGTDRIQLDEEFRSIEREINSSRFRDKIILRSKQAARPLDLLRNLNREKPDVLHISAHGAESGGIVLVGEDGGAQVVPGEDLRDIFSALEFPPKLVVLNACYSFNQAVEIVKTVDVLIGIPGPIADDYATRFSAALYMALSEGVSLSYSFRQAVIGAKLNSPRYWENGEPRILNKEGSTTNIHLVETDLAPPSENAILPRKDRKLFNERDLGRAFIKREFEQFAEKYPQVALVLLDISRMNQINMTFGRDVGDRILTEIMVLMERNFPQAIAVGICGDDTFFCAIDSNDSRYVRSFATRLMDIIESHNWGRIRVGLYVHLTAGYAVWDKPNERATDVIIRAGLALRDSQTDMRQVVDGTHIDLTKRIKGRALGSDRTIPEDLLKDLFS